MMSAHYTPSAFGHTLPTIPLLYLLAQVQQKKMPIKHSNIIRFIINLPDQEMVKMHLYGISYNRLQKNQAS